MGCGENLQYDERIRVFKTSRTLRIGPGQPEPTKGEHKGLLRLQPHSTFELTDRLTMFLPAREHTVTWGSACFVEDTEILLADGTFVSLLHSIGKAIWTDQQDTRRIKRIHKFVTLETDPPLYEIEGNRMTASHFTRKGPGEKWHRAFEIRGSNKPKRRISKGNVYAVELDTDDCLTLRGGIQAATFGNCLIVEPYRQGCTQDFRFNMDQALRRKNLLKAHTIDWHHGGIGHRADGSLILDTDRIKLPQKMNRDLMEDHTTKTPLPPKQRVYRACGRCRKPDAKLKCACLATHYCDTRCQREDMPDHRQKCTHMTLKDAHLIQSQLDQHKTNHGQFTIEVARLELVLTETHVKLADLLRS